MWTTIGLVAAGFLFIDPMMAEKEKNITTNTAKGYFKKEKKVKVM